MFWNLIQIVYMGPLYLLGKPDFRIPLNLTFTEKLVSQTSRNPVCIFLLLGLKLVIISSISKVPYF